MVLGPVQGGRAPFGAPRHHAGGAMSRPGLGLCAMAWGAVRFLRTGRQSRMLEIYRVSLVWLKELVRPMEAIRRKDPDLARQLRRSSTSVALNLAEGMSASGAVRTNCYSIALREARESLAALEVGQCLGYVRPSARVLGLSNRIVGTCHRLVHPRPG